MAAKEIHQMTKIADEAMRLDIFVAKEWGISRSAAKNAIDGGLVLVNGAHPAKAGLELKAGDSVDFDPPPPKLLEVKAADIPLDIRYEDEYFAVINKPQGMVVHQAASYTSNDTLVNALLYRLDSLSSINGVVRPGIVHRLDKDTSGLIVVAKNDEAHRSLSSQIAKKTARRQYFGLCDGTFKETVGTINAPIARCKWDRKRMAIDESGRYAVTHYRVITQFKNCALVLFELETGRTHQIRVHAASIHHPIVGDRLYGGSTELYDGGQLLHAAILTLDHPKTGERMRFTCPLPPHFRAVLKKLRGK